MEELINGLNLVLLGKQGDGKSATGNTILGRKVFKPKRSSESIADDVVEESGTVSGLLVTIYDTPGFSHMKQKENEIQQKYQSVFQKCESAPCVFLLVIKADRFTEEDRKTVEKIEKLLGQERLQKTWILFTRGDELEEENLTIKELINENKPLKKLLQKYDQRFYVFNNKKKGHSGQVTMLLAKILKTCVKKTDTGALEQLPAKRCKLMSRIANKSTRMVLLGETGVGKSAAGNTILGKKVFGSAETSKCLKKHTTVAGRTVSVVDPPDFFNTKMNSEQLVRQTERSIYLSSPGQHAFLIVFPVNMRFTEREEQILQLVQILFGEDVLKYSIILFTHGDQLEGGSIEKLIEENCALRHLVQQCGDRYHVFNNKNNKDKKQVSDLLQMIDRMTLQNGGYYINEMFDDAHILKQFNHNFNWSVFVVNVAIGACLGALCGASGGALAAAVRGGEGGVAGSAAFGAVAGGALTGAGGEYYTIIGGAIGAGAGFMADGTLAGVCAGAVCGALGSQVGGKVGGKVGGAVGGAVGDIVSDVFGSTAGDVVGGTAGGIVGGVVGGGVGATTGGLLGLVSGEPVGGFAGGVVGGFVGGAVGGAVEGANRSRKRPRGADSGIIDVLSGFW